MIQKKWSTIKLRTLLILTVIISSLAVFLPVQDIFAPAVEKVVKVNPRVRFLFSIYGEQGIGFLHPMSVFVDEAAGLVYVANTEKHKIDVFDEQGSFQLSFGSFGAAKGQLSFPYGLAKLPNGSLLVTESGNGRVQEFSTDGKSLGFLVTNKNKFGLEKPGPIRVDRQGRIYIADLSAGKVFVLSDAGRLLRTIKDSAFPHGLAINEDQQLIYAANAQNGAIKSYPLDEQKPLTTLRTSFANLGLIRGIDVDAQGNLYVVNSLLGTVSVFNQAGTPKGSFGVQGNENGQMLYPNGIEVTTGGRVYIADWGNNRVNVWEARDL